MMVHDFSKIFERSLTSSTNRDVGYVGDVQLVVAFVQDVHLTLCISSACKGKKTVGPAVITILARTCVNVVRILLCIICML